MTLHTEHRLTLVARCPVDDSIDVYDVRVFAVDLIVPVEQIIEAAAAISHGEPLYQEDVTSRLARELGLTVTTTGTHSGVRTICTDDGGERE